ncbi:MAG: ferric reductase-like transmembrane domain-containing protein [Planctomycetota bacterium]
MQHWHLVNVRGLVYGLLAFMVGGIAYSCFEDTKTMPEALIMIRQTYGLRAMIFLFTALFTGPLFYVLPWLPLKAHLLKGRRAVGVSAFVFAFLHSLCYLVPVLMRNWRELYTPGTLWWCGLALGAVATLDMAALAITSRDKAVHSMGPKRWKRWHNTAHLLLFVVLIHAIFNGIDFGVNHAPDVKGEADYGCLIGFSIAALIWLVLFILRKKSLQWTPRALRRIK